MLPVLIISLAAAVLSGAAIFARSTVPHGYALEIVFGLSAAVFLGTLLIVVIRRAALTLQNGEEERASEGHSEDRRKSGRE